MLPICAALEDNANGGDGMSPAVGILILALIGAALVCAALYGLLGKPSSHEGKKRKQEVVNGFRLAGGILLGMVLMGCLVIGAGEAFGTVQGTRLSAIGKLGAFAVALVSLGLIITMVKWWAKYFAGWMAGGVVNAGIMASSGHLVNNPAIPLSRTYALVMVGLFSIQVLTTKRFTKSYKLYLGEKTALILWVLAFTWAANMPRFAIRSMSIASAALTAACWYHRRKRQRHPHISETHCSQPHTVS
jgi:hypothetical protein